MAILIQRALSEGNAHCKEEPLSSVRQGQRALQEGGEADGQGNAQCKEEPLSSFGQGQRALQEGGLGTCTR